MKVVDRMVRRTVRKARVQSITPRFTPACESLAVPVDVNVLALQRMLDRKSVKGTFGHSYIKLV